MGKSLPKAQQLHRVKSVNHLDVWMMEKTPASQITAPQRRLSSGLTEIKPAAYALQKNRGNQRSHLNTDRVLSHNDVKII